MRSKPSKIAILTAVCLAGIGCMGAARAGCISPSSGCATEWSGGSVINLGGSYSLRIPTQSGQGFDLMSATVPI